MPSTRSSAALLAIVIAVVSSTIAPNATASARSRSFSSAKFPCSAGSPNMIRIAVRSVPRKPTAV